MNNIYTVGYARWTPEQLKAQLEETRALLLDIRFRPWSKRVEWQQPTMRAFFGPMYRHEPALGNKNYNNGGAIELANPGKAMGWIEQELVHRPVILLCGCYDVQTCHRKVAAEFLADQLGCSIIHLEKAIQDWDAKHRKVARPELPILAGIADADARLYLRFYLRSNIPADQEIARARCLLFNIDYAAARDDARRA